MSLVVRSAEAGDANAMARILNAIIEIGGTTAYRGQFDEQRVLQEFVSCKLLISCFVALEGSDVLGFQTLVWCDPNWPGEDRLPEDWAVIASYVDPTAQKKGVGSALFSATTKAAKEAGVKYIDATIRKENTGGQTFYGSLGFRDYRAGEESISKRFAPA